jgi:hypothetical protein
MRARSPSSSPRRLHPRPLLKHRPFSPSPARLLLPWPREGERKSGGSGCRLHDDKYKPRVATLPPLHMRHGRLVKLRINGSRGRVRIIEARQCQMELEGVRAAV